MIKNKSYFNKKKWLRNNLDDILRLKKDGLTHQSIIQTLQTQQKMPFDLGESLLSRYLKEFANDESASLQTKTTLNNKLERQNARLIRQNNEIQNLKRRLDRMAEREMQVQIENKNLNERNHLLEGKFLDGEARLEELLRYKGLHNAKWKVADLEQQNDKLLHQVLRLERLLEDSENAQQQLHQKLEQQSQYAVIKTKRITDLTHENQTIEAKLKQAFSEKELLTQNISTLNQQIEHYQEAEKNIKSRYKSLQGKFDEAYGILEEQHQTILKHENNEKQSRFWKW